MIINVETKFNVEDEVYVIYEGNKYNDLYRTESEWKIYNKPNDFRKIYPWKIRNIHIVQYKETCSVLYDIDRFLFSEDYLFKTLEEAQEKCRELNRIS